MLKKRSFCLFSHPTSVRLEPEFWSALEEIALQQGLSLTRLLETVDQQGQGNLASRLRVFVLLNGARR